MHTSQDTLQPEVSPPPTAAAAQDGVQSYVALAIPLLHVLQEGRMAQAAAVARHMTQRWGEGAKPAAELLKVLDTVNHEDSGELEEWNEDAEASSSSSSALSGVNGSRSTSSSSSSSSTNTESGTSTKNMVDEWNVLQTLRQIVRQLPPAGGDIAGDTETEEERRIFDGIACAVEREMKRLAIVRKHR